MKKIIILTIIVFQLLYLNSCKPDGTCPGNPYEHYKTTEMIIATSKYENSANCNEKTSGLPVIENESIKYSKLILTIYFKIDLVSEYYYYECANPEIIDTIRNLIITSNNDYNDQYKKGDTLNNIIKLNYFIYGSYYGSCLPLSDYLNNDSKCRFGFDFFFTEPPQESTLQKFHIYYEENNGTVYQADFTAIYLEP